MVCQSRSRAYWPPPPSSFLPSALSSPLLYKRPTGSGEERLLPERGASDITDTDVLLPFIWSGSLSTAITGREIKTGPSGGIASPLADGCVRVNGLANGTWALSALAEWLAEEIGKLTDWQHVIKLWPTVTNICRLEGHVNLPIIVQNYLGTLKFHFITFCMQASIVYCI